MDPIMIFSQEVADMLGVPLGTIIGESETQRKHREWQERVAMLMRYDEELS